MPIYEYECQKCGEVIEVLQDINEEPLEFCDCGKKGRLIRLISLSSFQLKGSGWYATDYAKKPGIPPEAQDKGAGSSVDSPSKEPKEPFKETQA